MTEPTSFNPERLAVVIYCAVKGTPSADVLPNVEAAFLDVFRTNRSVLVKRIGLGGIALFERVTDALWAVTEFRHRVSQASEFGGPSASLSLHFGVAAGEVVELPDGDILGSCVITAARLANIADASDILLDENIPYLSDADEFVRFEEMPPVLLKGFDQPQKPFRLHCNLHSLFARRTGLPARMRNPPDEIVGRRHELDRLRQSWERAKAGESEFIQIVASPGMGKSALCSLFGEVVAADGGLVVFGASSRERHVPYEPLIDALRPVVAVSLSHWPLFNGPARVLGPSFGLAAAEPLGSDADAERNRLFDAFIGCIDRLVEQAPTLLVLDDLQWIDPASADVLLRLFSSRVGRRLLIVATVRDQDPDESVSLARLRKELAGLVHTSTVALQGLQLDDITELLGRRGIAADPLTIESIRSRSNGIPFLVRELATGAQYPTDLLDQPLTDRIRGIVDKRLDQVSKECRSVLAIAAVEGSDFDPVVVASATDDSEASLDYIDEAITAKILVERRESGRLRLAFEHELLREILRADLSKLRQQRLHRRLGMALEAQPKRDAQMLGQLARHFSSCADLGESERALRYSAEAARNARSMYAYEQAVTFFQQALLHIDDGASEERADLLVRLGESMMKAGDPASSKVFDEAAELAEALGSGELMASVIIGSYRGTFGEALKVDAQRVTRLRSALHLLDTAPGQLRAKMLAYLAVELVWDQNWVESRERIDAALAMVPASDEDLLLEVLLLRAWVVYHPMEARIAESVRCLELAKRSKDISRQFAAASAAAFTYSRAAQWHELQAALDEMNARCRELRTPIADWQANSRNSAHAILIADFASFDRLVAEGFELGVQTGQPDARAQRTVQRFWLSYEIDPAAVQAQRLRKAVAVTELLDSRSALSVSFALTELGLFDDAALVYSSPALRGFDDTPLDQLWLWSMCLHARVQAATHPGHDNLSQLATLLAPYRNCIANMNFSSVGPVARYLGLLQTALGEHALAEREFATAIACAESMSARGWVARTQLDLALLYRNTGRHDDSGRIAADVRYGARKLGMVALAEAADELGSYRA